MRRSLITRTLSFSLAALCAVPTACTAIEYEDDWMDSPPTEDPSIAEPERFLVSERGEPTDDEKDTPVIVLAHGWSGSTYAWSEFADFARDEGALVSNVLLGGHGRSIDVFQETSVDEYGAPLRDELARLDALGYRNVNVALSMASSAVYLRLLAQDELDDVSPPQRVAFLSPQIINANKLLYASGVVGPVLNNVPSNNSEEEKLLWYTNRPHQALHQLEILLVETEQALRDGELALPAGTRARMWVAEEDPISDPAGFDVLQDNLSADGVIERTTVNSSLQTFWRGIGRPRAPEGELHVWTDADQGRAEAAWHDFYEFLADVELD